MASKLLERAIKNYRALNLHQTDSNIRIKDKLDQFVNFLIAELKAYQTSRTQWQPEAYPEDRYAPRKNSAKLYEPRVTIKRINHVKSLVLTLQQDKQWTLVELEAFLGQAIVVNQQIRKGGELTQLLQYFSLRALRLKQDYRSVVLKIEPNEHLALNLKLVYSRGINLHLSMDRRQRQAYRRFLVLGFASRKTAKYVAQLEEMTGTINSANHSKLFKASKLHGLFVAAFNAMLTDSEDGEYADLVGAIVSLRMLPGDDVILIHPVTGLRVNFYDFINLLEKAKVANIAQVKKLMPDVMNVSQANKDHQAGVQQEIRLQKKFAALVKEIEPLVARARAQGCDVQWDRAALQGYLLEMSTPKEKTLSHASWSSRHRAVQEDIDKLVDFKLKLDHAINLSSKLSRYLPKARRGVAP